jgi:hypothetical protein
MTTASAQWFREQYGASCDQALMGRNAETD